MTRIVESADSFVDDALEGFALVNSEIVRRVDGGIVRSTPLAPGSVAVVVGGGSGHYPAFAGVVGEGFAAGAVCGNIFSSPSAGQAYRVAEAANVGGGVLFSYGNYAGDVIHFGEAQKRLNAAGIETRTVLVTDDIASAPVDDISLRRGIAGDFCVFRIAGAAAERGATLDEVERLAIKTNDRTRTLGVAFAGCTLPGATEPLFSVPEGMMSVGLGIHGEPGIRDVPLQAAKELARTLVDPLLDERPAGAGDRVVLILNGLGAVKYEELFVLYRYASELLSAAGLEIVQPECGELVTSLDMAGVSATLLWLDDELEDLWATPTYTPAYRKGAVTLRTPGEPVADATAAPKEHKHQAASPASIATAKVATRAIAAAREVIAANADDLGRLDAIAGDGDHGIGMLRGLDAALAYAEGHAADGVESLMTGAGDAWSELAGGTSGALWGAALAAVGSALAASATASDVSKAVDAALARIQELGKAKLGDKTMVDALVPFADTLRDRVSAGESLRDALAAAADAADEAACATAELVPRLGRARPLAERSKGHQDPGATSFALIVHALTEVVP